MSQRNTVAGSRLFSVISQLLLTYFPVISQIFPISQLFLSYFLLISQLFLPFPNYFWYISHFSTTELLHDYFSSTISQLLLDYFLVTPRRVKTVFNIK